MQLEGTSGHVAIATSNFWPEPTGTSQTVTEFAEFLAQRGIQVRVATSMPYFPEWHISPEYRGALWRRDQFHGIEILRSWHYVNARPTTLTRLLHEFTLSLLSVPNLIRVMHRARVAFVATPALSYAVTALSIAALLRRRRVLIVKDIMPDAAVELGMLRNPIAIRLSRWLAQRAYALAHEIHTLGEGMRRRIARRTRWPGKIRIVPDTVDGAELSPVPFGENEFRRKLVPPGIFAVVHTGNMGRKQDLDLLLRAAELLRGDALVQFHVFGDGAERDRFLAALRKQNLENISHHPLQPRPMLRHMLSGADVVLVSQRPEVVDIVVPSKLITSLAAGAMVVAACDAESETARMVTESGGGIVVPAGDERALVEGILSIRDGHVDVRACRDNARRYALKRFDRRAVYGPLAASLGTTTREAWSGADWDGHGEEGGKQSELTPPRHFEKARR